MCSQRTRSADIGILGRRRLLVGRGEQRVRHVVGVGGLGQVVDGAELHRGDGGGDVAVAGQHDGACVGADLGELRDDVEAVAVLQPHVDDGEGRRLLPDQVEALGDRVGRAHLEAARLHGTRQPLEERPVVVDQDERAIFRQLVRSE